MGLQELWILLAGIQVGMAVGTCPRDMPQGVPHVPPAPPQTGRRVQCGDGPSCHHSRHQFQNRDHVLWMSCGSRNGVVLLLQGQNVSATNASSGGFSVLVCAGNPLCLRDTQKRTRHLQDVSQRSRGVSPGYSCPPPAPQTPGQPPAQTPLIQLPLHVSPSLPPIPHPIPNQHRVRDGSWV